MRLIRGEAVNVSKPDGSPLMLFRPGAISKEVCELARPALRRAGSPFSGKRRFNTGVIGYNILNGVCGPTEFTKMHGDLWGLCLPLIWELSDVYERELPEMYKRQRQVTIGMRHFIRGTPFTTATVNRWDDTHDARTRLHIDRQDLPQGFGVLSVINAGEYSGAELIFPKFRVAVDMRTTDVLLADVHEYHGNGPIEPQRHSHWERIATICYFKTLMRNCRY